MDPLASTIVDYCQLLNEARSPRVAQWQPPWLEQCSEWCLYLETELLAMDATQRDACRQAAVKRMAMQQESTNVPDMKTLLDAHRQLYLALLANVNTSNDLYWALMKTYAFLSHPNSIWTEDMESLAQKAAAHRTLQELKQILHEDE